MSEQPPIYECKTHKGVRPTRAAAPPTLPLKAHKLALRLLQLAKEPGEYEFTLIVAENGRWQLKPPAPVEELGL